MDKHNAIWGIDVKRLTFFIAVSIALCGVAHLAHTTIAQKISLAPSSKDITHQTHGFVHMKCQTIKRCDTGCILTAVLQQKQRIVEPLIDRLMRKKSHNPTHLLASSVKRLKLLQQSRAFTCEVGRWNPASSASSNQSHFQLKEYKRSDATRSLRSRASYRLKTLPHKQKPLRG